MPIYEYVCPSCGVEIEKFFKSIREGGNFLPVCQCETTMVKLISSNSFRLKGEGWFSKKTKNIMNKDE